MKAILVLVACIAVPSISQAQTSGSSINVIKLDNDRFELTLKNDRIADVVAGQQELLPTARTLCDGKTVQYGRYEFVAKDPLGDTGAVQRALWLRQEIHCDASPTGLGPPAVRDASWQPSDSDKRAVEQQTYNYFLAKDSGKYSEAYGMLRESMQSLTPFDRWQSGAREFNTKSGKALARQIRKITWYKDPPGAPVPGVYAATDFVSRFEKMDIHCGYLMWHQQSNGFFQLVREEQGYIEKSVQEKLSDKDLAAWRGKLRC